MNFIDWATEQMNKAGITDERKTQFETILNTFADQGHSGFSAGYALSFIDSYSKNGYEKTERYLNNILEKYTDNEDNELNMQKCINNDILAIIELLERYKFTKDECNKVVRLLDWKPITPLTGEDCEWGEPNDYGDRIYQQNKICSAVFRDNFDNSTAHYIDGRIYSEDGGHSWFTTNGRTLHSSIPVEFPFFVPDSPEKVYLNGEGSEEIITDKSRIRELYNERVKEYEND